MALSWHSQVAGKVRTQPLRSHPFVRFPLNFQGPCWSYPSLIRSCRAQSRSGPGARPINRPPSLASREGVEHQVTVLDDGFEYQGQRYASLSHVARVISGTPWNGFLFFGLQRRTQSSQPGEART